jgi:Fungal specific transcription factor domain
MEQFPGTLEERNYFQFFCTKTILQLNGLFESAFWNQQVLQACVSQPAIWHAAIAVASLHQERSAMIYEIDEDRGRLSDFTLGQYVKAMQHLRGLHQQPERPSAEVVLLCCVLFICFEASRIFLDSPTLS